MERKKQLYSSRNNHKRKKKIKLSYWDAVRNDVCVMIECCKDPMIWDVNAINCSKLAIIITSLSFKVRQISVLVTCNHLVQMKIPSEGENLPMKWWIFKQVKTCDLEEIYNITSECVIGGREGCCGLNEAFLMYILNADTWWFWSGKFYTRI